MPPIQLEDLIKCVGVIVAFSGTLLVAPGAVRLITRRASSRLRRLTTRRPVAQPLTASGSAQGLIQVTGISVGTSWNVRAFFATWTRLDRLERRVVELKQSVSENETKIAAERSERERDIQQLTSDLEREASALWKRLDEMEREDVEVEATALPTIGLGIVLGGIPEMLSHWPAVGVLFMAAALYALAWSFRQHRVNRTRKVGLAALDGSP